MRKAFTLMEVNLAILVMATGILAVVSLFSFGYRENRQSREDVAATVYADAVMSRMTMALTATNLPWSVFKALETAPSENQWADYINNSDGLVIANPDSKAQSAYDAVMGKLGSTGATTSYPKEASSGLKAGLVVVHDENSPVVKIGFRAARHANELLAMPMFFTEVRFQGLPDK